jgi:hypothetical protein
VSVGIFAATLAPPPSAADFLGPLATAAGMMAEFPLPLPTP